jgi:hypothetical protein
MVNEEVDLNSVYFSYKIFLGKISNLGGIKIGFR